MKGKMKMLKHMLLLLMFAVTGSAQSEIAIEIKPAWLMTPGGAETDIKVLVVYVQPKADEVQIMDVYCTVVADGEKRTEKKRILRQNRPGEKFESGAVFTFEKVKELVILGARAVGFALNPIGEGKIGEAEEPK